MIELIPAIDLMEGQVVRLREGDYARATYYGSPLDTAQYWLEQGASKLHVVDLDGAKEGKLVNLQGLQQIVNTGIQVQFGGGIRSWDTLEHLFELGVRHAILGTAAVQDPDLLIRALHCYKSHALLALDARYGRISVEGWLKQSEVTTVELLENLSQHGLSRFIYTNISRDGTLKGPDLSGALELCRRFPHMSCILSGGVSSLSDLEAVRRQASDTKNLEGVISGTALYENRFTYKQAQDVLQAE